MDADPERERLLKALSERQEKELQELRERQRKESELIKQEQEENRTKAAAKLAEEQRREIEAFQARSAHLGSALLNLFSAESEAERLIRRRREYDAILARHQEEADAHERHHDWHLRHALGDLEFDHERDIEEKIGNHEKETERYLKDHELEKGLRELIEKDERSRAASPDKGHEPKRSR